MEKFKWALRRLIHWLIYKYLLRAGSAFHTFSYGPSGRYIVLMNERQFHDYTCEVRDRESSE